jgi:hypothetical protein
MYVILYLKCVQFVSDVSEDRNVSTNFSKNLKYEISGNSNRHKPRHSLRTDWMKDMKILRAVFHNRCANPNNKWMAIINILDKSKEIVWQKDVTTIYSKTFQPTVLFSWGRWILYLCICLLFVVLFVCLFDRLLVWNGDVSSLKLCTICLSFMTRRNR